MQSQFPHVVNPTDAAVQFGINNIKQRVFQGSRQARSEQAAMRARMHEQQTSRPGEGDAGAEAQPPERLSGSAGCLMQPLPGLEQLLLALPAHQHLAA